MTARILPANPTVTAILDEWLLDPSTGRIRLLHAGVYMAIHKVDLCVWATRRARYTLPTVEMVEFLRTEIGGRTALEIGSGNGDLGFHLGIRETDSYQQQDDETTKLYLSRMQQTGTNPPATVEKMTARDAVHQYKPQVVLGAWITQKCRASDAIGTGNMLGPEEEKIIGHPAVETYIHIGHSRVHANKRILASPHRTYQGDWIVSRLSGMDNDGEDVIWIWDRKS